MKLLCYLGIHRPLKNHSYYCIDMISRKQKYKAICPCGKQWLTDSNNPWLGFKIKLRKVK